MEGEYYEISLKGKGERPREKRNFRKSRWMETTLQERNKRSDLAPTPQRTKGNKNNHDKMYAWTTLRGRTKEGRVIDMLEYDAGMSGWSRRHAEDGCSVAPDTSICQVC